MTVIFGDCKDVVYNTSLYFKNTYETDWLLRIGFRKDVTVNLRHIMDFGNAEFDILIQNCGKHVHSMKELLFEAGEYV